MAGPEVGAPGRVETSSRGILQQLFSERRSEIVDWATDWVIVHSLDLGSRRPRDESRMLIERVLSANASALLDDDKGPLFEIIDFATSYRASSEFRISTPLTGFRSIRKAVEFFLLRDGDKTPSADAVAAILAVDELYFEASLRVAEAYSEKLLRTVQTRRHELEAEVAQVQAAIHALAAPILRVWEGVLVLPLIGELDAARMAELTERAMTALTETKSATLVLDLTGLALIDEPVSADLLRLVGGVRLLGARAIIVGLSPQVAQTIVGLDVDLHDIPSFATLYDALAGIMSRPKGDLL